MRKMYVVVIIFSLWGVVPSWAQEDPCQAILREGLYKTYKITRSSSFTQDMKSYFASNQFKKDFQDKKWSGGVSAILDSGPVELSADATDLQIDQFRSSVNSSSSFSTDQKFFEHVLSKIPSSELAEKFNECEFINQKTGFILYPPPTIDDKNVVFHLIYRNQFAANPMPTVTSFNVINGTNVQSTLLVGHAVSNSHEVSCERDPNKDLIFVLETNIGAVTYNVPAEPIGFNRDFPIGTIIASYLDFDQFSAATQNNLKSPSGIWTAKFSKWAPADGRSVLNSQFQLISNASNVPDLRGTFLRGLNIFDPSEVTHVDPTQKDPQNRTVGDFQGDMFKSHEHVYADGSGAFNFNNTGTNTARIFGNKNANTSENGGEETRPKNVAIYYYIRIN